MKLIETRPRNEVGAAVGIGCAYMGGMPDVNAHVARVAADSGDDVGVVQMTEFAREVLSIDPLPSLAYSAAGGFKAGVAYSLKPTDGSGDFTVSRAGTTGYTQTEAGLWRPAAENEPRFTASNGIAALLVEAAATNLITYPKTFSNAYWTKSGATVDNNSGAGYDSPFVDSNGVNTKEAFKLVESNTNASHSLNRAAISKTAGSVLTFSVRVKKAERSWVMLNYFETGIGDKLIYYNINTGVIGTISAGVTAKITANTLGYYNCEFSLTTGSTTGAAVAIFTALDNNTHIYQGNGTSGIYISHAQLELGTAATSPIGGAEGSVQTRNADVISKTGIGALIGQTEGTIVVDVDVSRLNYETAFVIIYNPAAAGGVTGRITIEKSSINQLRCRVQTASLVTFGETTITTGRYKIGVAYKANDCVFAFNGVQRGISNSVNLPSDMSVMQLGAFQGGLLPCNESIELAYISKTRVTNAKLIELTTL